MNPYAWDFAAAQKPVPILVAGQVRAEGLKQEKLFSR
jgi:hypothetical protein